MYVKVSQNDVHSIRERKLKVRLWSAFCFTDVQYDEKVYVLMSILLTVEISA